MRIWKRQISLGLAVATLFLLPVAGADTIVGGGWTRSDVGLDAEGDGFYLAAGLPLAWDHPVFDAAVTAEYVQKKGSQPTAFSDPVGGFTDANAAVTLHVIETAIFLGARVADLPVVPRVYVGGAIALKIDESWSDFPGIPDQAYGYKDTDLIAHVGGTLTFGRLTLDVRYSKSLVGQLLLDNQPQPLLRSGKADTPDGVRVPEEGFRTETLRVGLMAAF